MGKDRGPRRLEIPETYEDPVKDVCLILISAFIHSKIHSVKEKLDSEVRAERDVQFKARSPGTSTAAQSVSNEKSRSRGSNHSSSTKKSGAKASSPGLQSLDQDEPDPLANFADFEQSAPVYQATTIFVESNPFESKDTVDEIVSTLSALRPSDLADVIQKLIARNPSVRATISACTSI